MLHKNRKTLIASIVILIASVHCSFAKTPSVTVETIKRPINGRPPIIIIKKESNKEATKKVRVRKTQKVETEALEKLHELQKVYLTKYFNKQKLPAGPDRKDLIEQIKLLPELMQKEDLCPFYLRLTDIEKVVEEILQGKLEYKKIKKPTPEKILEDIQKRQRAGLKWIHKRELKNIK